MQKGQTSRRGGIQDLLCPFEYVKIIRGAGAANGHEGTMAVDIGYKTNPHEPYYAPCDVKCVMTVPGSGQGMWQSLERVRMANGNIDYVTFVTAHDNSFDAYVGQIVAQGVQLGNKGDKGNATGPHCHIEIATGQKDSSDWYKYPYGDHYTMNDEIDFDNAFFMDNTEIVNTLGTEDWKYLSDVPVSSGADQVLHVGSKVRINGVFRVDEAYGPSGEYVNGKIGCYATCYGAPCGQYDYIPCGPLIKCNADGSGEDPNAVLYVGNYWKCNTIFTVLAVEGPSAGAANGVATLQADGVNFRIDCGVLYEISDQ